MSKLLNKNSVPSTPKGWRFKDPDAFIAWTTSEPFDGFAAKVHAFAQANNLPDPSDDQIEERICEQLPKEWCSGGVGIVNRGPSNEPGTYTGGCAACGHRR